MKSKLLQGKKILLGISGGIAAYKACQLLRDLQNSGAEVRVTMTPDSQKFIGMETFKALTKYPVFTDIFESEEQFAHIEYPHWADLYLIAPATANTLAKFVQGIGDNSVSLSYLACPAPKVVVPAMNPTMFKAPAVQENLEKLKSRGDFLVDPEEGIVACGHEGPGRFPENDEIILSVCQALRASSVKQPLAGKTMLITAGRTEEKMDPVRYISNRSSGKTAISLAQAFWDAGAKVTFIHGPMDVQPPTFSENIRVLSAIEMHQAVMERVDEPDYFIMNAAVADFRPKNTSDQKMKGSSEAPILELSPNPNILKDLGDCIKSKSSEKTLIGFALETDNLDANAKAKLKKSPCDILVLNTPVKETSGFGKSSVEAAFVYPGQEVPPLELMEKDEIGQRLVEFVSESTISGALS